MTRASGATAGTLVRSIQYELDEVGRLKSASDPDSSYTFSYDALDRVTTVDNNGTPGVPRVILTSTYDAAGNRATLSASIDGVNDFINTYTHDFLNRLTRLDQTGQAGGNVVADKRVDISYNALGQYTQVARYNDTDGAANHHVMTSTYQYDALHRLIGLNYQDASGGDIVTPMAWTYDNLSTAGLAAIGSAGMKLPGDPRVAATAVLSAPRGFGRITQMTNQDGTVDYQYDPTSQLTAADYSDPNLTDESYSYDQVGNRTTSGYQTGTGNRLLNDGTYSYQYDDEGNRISRTNTATGEVTEYTWDFRNRLTKVTEKDASGAITKVVEYTYDVFDRRIARKVDTTSPFDMQDAAIERYVYDDIHNAVASSDGGNVVLDFVDDDGPAGQGAMTLSKRYLWGERVDELFAQEDVTKGLSATDRVLWPVVDHLGTVRDLVKQDGTVATHFQYDAFGAIVSGDTSLTRYLFTSREYDTQTALQYNRARWFDPSTGRWISEDPLGFAAGDVNLYRYVGNGPVDATDPSGLQERPKPPGYGTPLDEPAGKITIDGLIQGHLIGRIIQIGKLDTFNPTGKTLECGDYGEFEKAFAADIRTILFRLALDYRGMNTPEEGLKVRMHRDRIKNPSGPWRWPSTEPFDTGWWLNGAHRVDAEMEFTIKIVGEELQMTNIRTKWTWRDEIDARSVGQWWSAKETWWETFKGIPNLIVESVIWDWYFDGLLDTDFDIIITTPWIESPDITVPNEVTRTNSTR